MITGMRPFDSICNIRSGSSISLTRLADMPSKIISPLKIASEKLAILLTASGLANSVITTLNPE
jgi:hypothetical protein